MDKLNFLIKTLSKTNRKDYENYCVNRIYNLLNDLEIKPMTQKHVRKEQGWYLIDLYFPQFNLGIEIDEKHHLKKKEADKLRAEHIISEYKGYIEERITITNSSMETINKRIDEIVSKIRDLKRKQETEGTFKKWEIVTAKEYLHNKLYIEIEDDVTFKTNVEATNTVFASNHLKFDLSYAQINTMRDREERWCCWFPKLHIESNTRDDKKWENTVNDDWTQIYEKDKNGKFDGKDFDKNENRVVFMKYKDPILGQVIRKFIGVYKPIEKKDRITTYQRIDTKFEIIK